MSVGLRVTHWTGRRPWLAPHVNWHLVSLGGQNCQKMLGQNSRRIHVGSRQLVIISLDPILPRVRFLRPDLLECSGTLRMHAPFSCRRPLKCEWCLKYTSGQQSRWAPGILGSLYLAQQMEVRGASLLAFSKCQVLFWSGGWVRGGYYKHVYINFASCNFTEFTCEF